MNTETRLRDLKARKGHLCQGGVWDQTEGPVCGCGALLATLPDFMDLPRDQLATNDTVRVTWDQATGQVTSMTEVPGSAPADDDPPPWNTDDDPQAVADQLEATGKAATERHDAPDMAPAVPPVDPTRPYGPGEVERAILDQVRRLELGIAHEANLIAAADQLKIEYELAYAHAVRNSTGGAADTRKADAVVQCERQYRAYMDACAARDAMKAVTHTLRSTLSGLQSVGRSVGVAYQSTSGRGR